MILHALTQYYQRKAKSDGGVAPNAEPMFYQCKAINGVIIVPPADSEEVKR